MVADAAPSGMTVAEARSSPVIRVLAWLAPAAEAVAIPLGAVLVGLTLFSLFLLTLGKSPSALVDLVWRGGFGSAFALQNSLQRAAPLLFAGLCVALPARLGLVVIGGEGAIVLGGLAAAVTAPPLAGLPAPLVIAAMALAALLAVPCGSARSGRSRPIAASTRRSRAC